jgi:hypothetical protein
VITESTLGNPPVRSTTLHQTQLNECAGSEDPADPTSCSNFSGVELSLASSAQAFIESNRKQLTEQTNTCITGASCGNTGEFIFVGGSFIIGNEFIRIVAEDQAM